jgi:hypothetical protein
MGPRVDNRALSSYGSTGFNSCTAPPSRSPAARCSRARPPVARVGHFSLAVIFCSRQKHQSMTASMVWVRCSARVGESCHALRTRLAASRSAAVEARFRYHPCNQTTSPGSECQPHQRLARVGVERGVQEAVHRDERAAPARAHHRRAPSPAAVVHVCQGLAPRELERRVHLFTLGGARCFYIIWWPNGPNTKCFSCARRGRAG